MPEDTDVGWGGAWTPMVVSEAALTELRNLAGPAPSPGKSWVMVNLKDGEFKWFTSQRRSTFGRSRARTARRRA